VGVAELEAVRAEAEDRDDVVIDALTPEQLAQLKTIADQVLTKLDPGKAC
jgi:tetrahydromethanopterin S-methyltransferase subunit B